MELLFVAQIKGPNTQIEFFAVHVDHEEFFVDTWNTSSLHNTPTPHTQPHKTR
jgi:hypothetical protein